MPHCEDNYIFGKWDEKSLNTPGYAKHVDPETSKDTAKKLWEISEELTKFKYSV